MIQILNGEKRQIKLSKAKQIFGIGDQNNIMKKWGNWREKSLDFLHNKLP